jgi:hypothetical protein
MTAAVRRAIVERNVDCANDPGAGPMDDGILALLDILPLY